MIDEWRCFATFIKHMSYKTYVQKNYASLNAYAFMQALNCSAEMQLFFYNFL